MTENELRSAVCAQAKAWLGRKEADGSHKEIIDLYNKYKKTGDYKMTYTDPWCAAFVSAVGMAVSIAKSLPGKPYDLIPSSAACETMITLYKGAQRWVEDDSYLPSPGDVILYDWQDSGVGDNTGIPDHVGIVVSVSGSQITLIEGNISDMVAYRTIQRDGRYIRGYGIPDYAGACSDPVKPTTEVPAANVQANTQPVANIPAGYFVLMLPTLRIGDKGSVVQSMQGELIALGYDCGPDGADGKFGSNTKAAVQRFQKDHDLEEDGIAGIKTRTCMAGVKE